MEYKIDLAKYLNRTKVENNYRNSRGDLRNLHEFELNYDDVKYYNLNVFTPCILNFNDRTDFPKSHYFWIKILNNVNEVKLVFSKSGLNDLFNRTGSFSVPFDIYMKILEDYKNETGNIEFGLCEYEHDMFFIEYSSTVKCETVEQAYSKGMEILNELEERFRKAREEFLQNSSAFPLPLYFIPPAYGQKE